jgi:protein disulfide-isomerase
VNVLKIKTLALLLVFICGFLCPVVQAQDEEPTWLNDLDAALAAAKDGNKKILVDFTASWCGWCTKLKEDVFSQKDFLAYAKEKLILVVIDADQKRDLVDQYGVQGFPTIILLDSAGKEAHRIVGYKPLNEFIEELKSKE